MKIEKNLHWLVCLLFFCCARQSAPTGGPKDTIPPILVRAIPPNEGTNFQDKTVELTFSEMIALNNPKEQLIVTPTIGKDFEVKSRKNSVIIELKDPLEDNTTYTFNFRDAVQDVTEKNSVRNFQFALSTGPYIDSLSIEGTIYDILKGEDKEDATVAIHQKNDTFSILKYPAVYFTKTNKAGRFKIDHLKPDIYYIYSFSDKNRNLIADSRNEWYGFLKDSINLNQDTTGISIGLVHQDARPLKVTSARPYNTYFNIRVSKFLKNFKLSPEDTTHHVQYAFGEDNSNIKLYNTFPKTDSVAIRLTATDSIENWLDTTLYAKFRETDVTPEKFDVKMLERKIIADKGQLHITLGFTKPIGELNFDSLYFEVDSLKKIYFTKEDLSWDYLYNVLTIRKKVDKKIFEGQKVAEQQGQRTKQITPADSVPKAMKIRNQLYAGRAAFSSVENDSSKKIIEKIIPLKTEDLSEIIFDIKANHKSILVQLLDNASKAVIQEKAYTLKGSFQDLPSGDYIMRVIIDTNYNGVWDAGNYLKKQEPEKIVYYRDEKKSARINLKPNWELELAPLLITY